MGFKGDMMRGWRKWVSGDEKKKYEIKVNFKLKSGRAEHTAIQRNYSIQQLQFIK